MGVARYDGVAGWYQGFRPSLTPDELDALQRLLGHGPGHCLDVGCGTVSEDMLEVGRDRGLEVVGGSADSLPFADGTFDAAVSVWTHIDVDDFAGAINDIARVLRPGAPLVYIGGHPCFVGPHSLFLAGEGVPELHSGYRPARHYDGSAPGVGNEDGLRARVGAVHLPLEAFLAAFLGAGFRIERFEEPGSQDYPHVVALRARR
ncbi:MAG: methyltransferase domain-containing protein [Actinobacteria bacterium]|nr:MAG: methyltransferase domain-containing protein [Actinomycetota bacterium]